MSHDKYMTFMKYTCTELVVISRLQGCKKRYVVHKILQKCGYYGVTYTQGNDQIYTTKNEVVEMFNGGRKVEV